MTRTDRIVAPAAFLVSFLVVMSIAGVVLGAAFGPIELLIGLAIALPLCMYVARLIRGALSRPPRASS